MKTNLKYTSDGKYSVYCRKIEIARSYLGRDGYELRVLQGMPRMETLKKIINDCPIFAANNNLNENIVPKLFSK